MKSKFFLILVATLFFYHSSAQAFLPKRLMVCAEKLNFRTAPNGESKVLDTFENGEILESIEVMKDEPGIEYNGVFSYLWIKVKRIKTNKVGYVFGQYVMPLNVGYFKGQDCERFPEVQWYGISQDGQKLKVIKTTPILPEGGSMPSITDSADSQVLIGSEYPLATGEITGSLRIRQNTKFRLGDEGGIYTDLHGNYFLQVTGSYRHENGILKKEKLDVHLVKWKDGKYIKTQTLTEQFKSFGSFGFEVVLVGDLNGDGTPELILSEGDGKNMALYYFLSDDTGKLFLQSITWQGPGC